MCSARTATRRQASGVRVGGVALDVMNQVPYKSDPRTEQWVSDSIDVARALNVRVVLLAFFDKGDLRNDADGQAEVIRAAETRGAESRRKRRRSRHRVVAERPRASAHPRRGRLAGTCRFTTTWRTPRRWATTSPPKSASLGRERICEFHAKENGFLLGQGRIDFAAVRKAMDDIGYAGWIQIEGAVPKGQPMLESYVENVRFMRTHFT